MLLLHSLTFTAQMKITLALSRARARWTVNFENACASEYLSSHCSIDHQTLADTMHARPLGERVAENGRTLHVPLNEHSIYTMHLSFTCPTTPFHIYIPNSFRAFVSLFCVTLGHGVENFMSFSTFVSFS